MKAPVWADHRRALKINLGLGYISNIFTLPSGSSSQRGTKAIIYAHFKVTRLLFAKTVNFENIFTL